MLATTMQSVSPFDSLLARIQSFLDDRNHPGFGSITTSADGETLAEVSMKPRSGEAFTDFARRVLEYADGATVVWTIQDRQIPIARVIRKIG